MRLDEKKRTLNLKLVYCGPGLSGKSTNLRRLHEALGATQRGPLIQLDTEAERTLFFDYFPAQLGALDGYSLRAHLFTVPGQSFYGRTRAAVLRGADAVVFVADSARGREAANALALADTRRLLDGLGLADVPFVFQWNKRDAPDALPVHTLERSLNPQGAPSCSAVAFQGDGVQACYGLVMRTLLSQLREGRRAPQVSGWAASG